MDFKIKSNVCLGTSCIGFFKMLQCILFPNIFDDFQLVFFCFLFVKNVGEREKTKGEKLQMQQKNCTDLLGITYL